MNEQHPNETVGSFFQSLPSFPEEAQRLEPATDPEVGRFEKVPWLVVLPALVLVGLVVLGAMAWARGEDITALVLIVVVVVVLAAKGLWYGLMALAYRNR